VKGGHRIYELGGVSHLDQGTHAQFKPATEQLIARHHPAAKEAPVCTVEDTDVPMRDVAQAAMANIDQWVSTGKAPPHTSRMQVKPTARIMCATLSAIRLEACGWRNSMYRW
jgi:hypothetical protein